MRFARELFAGEVAKASIEKTVKRLQEGEFREGYFLIVLSEGEQDLLEIVEEKTFSDEVYMKYNDTSELKVVGLAVSGQEARDLLLRIVMFIHKKTGGFDLKSFFHFE